MVRKTRQLIVRSIDTGPLAQGAELDTLHLEQKRLYQIHSTRVPHGMITENDSNPFQTRQRSVPSIGIELSFLGRQGTWEFAGKEFGDDTIYIPFGVGLLTSFLFFHSS
ncbi:hypothetical protein N7532_004654 [Penicillium argentinense]|uniref:Uncharacterized protein n=1 Tax=Penicillium argentinense TaxID=1131581 RepID=A0A9W9FPT5_9EURO|nr:uncharacterized protein N7532_004654 [Penicillium argentinense]KAJ5104125.1 hypothetical protein N7532_004654 [Penicillium argentinense]